MTTMMKVEEKCSVCGKISSFSVLSSSNSMGSPDLDLRPAPMYRYTINLWIHECPDCGYVAHDLSEEAPVPHEWLKTEEYRGCDGISFVSGLAEMFYKGIRYTCTPAKKETPSISFTALHGPVMILMIMTMRSIAESSP